MKTNKQTNKQTTKKGYLTILTLHNPTFTSINRETNNILYSEKPQHQFLDRLQDKFRCNTSSVYLLIFRS